MKRAKICESWIEKVTHFNTEDLIIDDGNSCVCSLHFRPSDFHPPTDKKIRRKLLNNAVPNFSIDHHELTGRVDLILNNVPDDVNEVQEKRRRILNYANSNFSTDYQKLIGHVDLILKSVPGDANEVYEM